MAGSRQDSDRVLAERWSAPFVAPDGEAGQPVICVASTYTFHAPYFESELLPRFLGLKFDETEGVRPFVVEREQALATTRVCVLVDADHVDPSQTTLRWDQLPVRVPGGAQHSKIVVLVWENCARLIVSSANMTRPGYRRNREMASVFDFCDGTRSTPRRLLLDALAFLRGMSVWVRASDTARARLVAALREAQVRVRSWRRAPADFKPLERPRATFVPAMPGPKGGVARSPMEEMLELWGTRRVSDVTVMTPFAGESAGPVNRVVERLMELPRTRDAIGYLVVPGHPSEANEKDMVVGLPRHFLDVWSAAWRIDPGEVQTYVVPLVREDETTVNRDLHAKAVLLGGDGATMLLCGSSNFTLHGMGVEVANVEANICYVDDPDARRAGLRLYERLPVDWTKDFCRRTVWPAAVDPIDDERQALDLPLPAVFLWAAYNQNTATLTLGVDPAAAFPSEWSLRWLGEQSQDEAPLADNRQVPRPPAEGRIVLHLPASQQGANIAGLRLDWRDDKRAPHSATLLVQVENGRDLLPPEEFRLLTADGILECLLSGREAAEWVEGLERRRPGGRRKGKPGKANALREVDTSSYLLYRTRRLGAALAALGERLLRTVRTADALAYRLQQDPLGPCGLAEALVREWRESGKEEALRAIYPAVLLFSLAEIKLMLAHVASRMATRRLRALFHGAIEAIDHRCTEVASSSWSPPPNLAHYLDSVKAKSGSLR